LGLVFLKYISDSFYERYLELKEKYLGMEEDRVSYEADNVFFVPKDARWEHIKAQAKQPNIGQVIDQAMFFIEKENQNLNQQKNKSKIYNIIKI
jgi:type I restriction enzyme M protein